MSTNLEEIILNLEQRIRELEQNQKLRSVSPFQSNSLNQVSGSARRININDECYIDADGTANFKNINIYDKTTGIHGLINPRSFGTGARNGTNIELACQYALSNSGIVVLSEGSYELDVPGLNFLNIPIVILINCHIIIGSGCAPVGLNIFGEPKHKIIDCNIEDVPLIYNKKSYPSYFGNVFTDVEINKSLLSTNYCDLDFKEYAISSSIQLQNNKSIANGTLNCDSNINIIELSSRCNVDNVVFNGSGKSSLNASQNGIFIDGLIAMNAGYANKITRCRFNDVGFSAIYIKRVVINAKGNIISDNYIDNCNIGMNLDTQGEYAAICNNIINECNTAYLIKAGNTNIVGGCVTHNLLAFNIIAGPNDAHGIVSNVLINHNTHAVRVEQINVKEFSFLHCDIYYGDIYLYKCQGVRFYNCVIDTSVEVYEEGALFCYFDRCRFQDGPFTNYPNYNDDPSCVIYTNSEWALSTLITETEWLNSAYSEVSVNSNIAVTNGDNFIVEFDTILKNSLCKNEDFVYWDLYKNDSHCWDFDFIFPTSNWLAYYNIQISIGKSSSFDPTLVEVCLYNITTNEVLSNFNYGVQQTDGVNYWRIYYFNGNTIKGQIQVRINNRSGSIIYVYANQASIPSIAKVIGW